MTFLTLALFFFFFRKVQEKHHLCHPRYPYPRCSCAVAVRSGKDVFIVDICNAKTVINFPTCDDKILKVIKVDDRYYKVKLVKVIFWRGTGVLIYKIL